MHFFPFHFAKNIFEIYSDINCELEKKVLVWIGGEASEGEKRNAMGYVHVSYHIKKIEYHSQSTRRDDYIDGQVIYKRILQISCCKI